MLPGSKRCTPARPHPCPANPALPANLQAPEHVALQIRTCTNRDADSHWVLPNLVKLSWKRLVVDRLNNFLTWFGSDTNDFRSLCLISGLESTCTLNICIGTFHSESIRSIATACAKHVNFSFGKQGVTRTAFNG